MSRTVYRLDFEALEETAFDLPPVAIRLRRLLKFALRGLRLKCVRIEELKSTGVDKPAKGKPR